MELEKFKQAAPIVDKIKNINALKKHFSIGKLSDSKDFDINSDDFFQADFFNIKEYKDTYRNGQSAWEIPRIKVTQYSDGSGAEYELTKQETIKLQRFIDDMLESRELLLMIEFEKL